MPLQHLDIFSEQVMKNIGQRILLLQKLFKTETPIVLEMPMKGPIIYISRNTPVDMIPA